MAQSNEIGLFFGRTLFHGDVGYINAEKSILNTEPVIGFLFKRNFNYHFGATVAFNRGKLSAQDSYSSDIFSIEKNLHFKSKITEFLLITEFNFRPYMSRDPDYNHTPFIFAGIARYFFNPQGQALDGNWYSLRPLTTEGQNSDSYPTRKLYELNGLAIPFGFGYKFNVYEYITVNLNLSWRITFTDYIDDVSTTYVDENILNELGATLANQSNESIRDGFQRGDPYNKDKYGFIGFSIIYSIKDPKKECENNLN